MLSGMEDLSGLVSVRRVLATEARLREVREAMDVLIPVESEADLAALRVRLEQDPVDAEAARFNALGGEMAVLDRRVLEESQLALEEMGFDAAAAAVAYVVDEVRREDAAVSAG